MTKELLQMLGLNHNAIIPMLHRVGTRDSSRIPANQNMKVHLDDLVSFIHSARNQGWTFISLDQLVELVRHNKSSQHAVSLTFDDGYLDNYQKAYPVLNELGVPFCVYITTGFIDNKVLPWWYRLEDALLLGSEIVDPNGKLYRTETVEEMNIAFMCIRKDLMANQQQYQRYTTWLGQFGSGISLEKPDRLFMNWQELQKLAKSDLVTIGAHTMTHPVLSTLDDSLAYDEIKMSMQILSTKLNQEIKHFAFPFGGKSEVSERDLNLVRRIGFCTAVTTRHGGINTGQNVDLSSLPRIFFGPTFHLTPIRYLSSKHKLRRLIKRIVWIDP